MARSMASLVRCLWRWGHRPFLAGLVLVAFGMVGAAWAGSSVSSAAVSAVSGAPATVEAVLTGPNAQVVVNGDRIELRDGRLSINGASYGAVGARSVVRYRVRAGERTVLVDGVVRHPAE